MTIQAKLSKAALNKALEEMQRDTASVVSQPKSSFREVLNAQMAGQELLEILGLYETDISPGVTMQSIDAKNVDVAPNDVEVGVGEVGGTQKVVHLLSEVNKGQLQMDSLINEILYSGKRFTNQELLAIQAHVFHFAQMTELTVKVAEQTVSSIKSIQNTQVQ